MKRFTRLFLELDETQRAVERIAAMATYFRETDAADAAWALHLLCGRKLARTVPSPALRMWAGEEAGLPSWLLDECHETVGDVAETIALVLPEAASTQDLRLHELLVRRLLPLRTATVDERKSAVTRTWRELNAMERIVWNKLLTGTFRAGVAQTLVIQALASVA